MTSPVIQGLTAPYTAALNGDPVSPWDPIMGSGLMGLLGGTDRMKAGNPGTDTGSYGGGPRGWVNEAIDITGVNQSWLKPLMQLMGRESGGDPNAYNDTPVASGQHAQGLFQTIPSTFQAYNEPGLGGINDPVANAVAAINYIVSRYGNPGNLPTSGGY